MNIDLTNIEAFYSVLGIFLIAFICYKIKESKHWINRKIFQKGKPDIDKYNLVIQNRNHVHTHRYGVFYIGWLGVFFSVFMLGISWQTVCLLVALSGLYMVLDILLNMKMHNYDPNWGIWHLGDEFWDRIAPWPVRFGLLILGMGGFFILEYLIK